MDVKTETGITGIESDRKPLIKLEFYFSAHGTKEDLENLKSKFDECDVFIPEMYGWNENVLNDFRKISSSELNPEEYLSRFDRKSAQFTQLESIVNLIKGSNKPIFFADVHSDQAKDRYELYAISLSESPSGKTFEDELDRLQRQARLLAHLSKEREDLIAKNLKARMEEFTKVYPQLRKNDEIKTLVLLGGSHTGVYHRLKADTPVSRSFSQMPFVFGPSFNEVSRRIFYGKEVSKTLIARALLERDTYRFLGGLLTTFIPDSLQKVSLIKRFYKNFSYEEIKQIYDESQADDENLGRLIAEKFLRFTDKMF
jgi:hypothetical protein